MYMHNLTGLGYDPASGLWRSKSGLNYSFLFFYEKKFYDEKFITEKTEWIETYWRMCFVYSFVYIVSIYTGQRIMKDRVKFEFRQALIAWNMVLSLFSAFGAARIWPEFIHTLTTRGVEHSVCSNDFAHGVSGCWSTLFVASKLPELFDTFFIVVRKQKLIFLHWYHHATVLIYCWYSTHDFSATGRWFVMMNFTVHAVMYGYYAFRAMRFNVPKWIMIAITTGQILQMVIGIYINLLAIVIKRRGEPCATSYDNIKWSFIMYLSYFLLFSYFFYGAYIKKTHKQMAKQQAAAAAAAAAHEDSEPSETKKAK